MWAPLGGQDGGNNMWEIQMVEDPVMRRYQTQAVMESCDEGTYEDYSVL